jgi:tRNA (cmo5U34)-methyltransferase
VAIDDAFNQSVAYYDSWVRNAIPCYDELFAVALENIPSAPDTRLRVLDLGAGTGLFSWQVWQKYPNAAFILIDMADQMLETAKGRFAGFEKQFEYVVDDYRRGLPSAGHDLIISSLSIHHLADAEKRTLFAEVHRSLKPGGIFINIDQIKGPSRHFQKLYWDIWLRRVRGTDASQEQIEQSIQRRSQLDQDATMADQIDWLREAGFARVDCLYHHYFVGVFFAQKQGPGV